jgi:3-hydroxyisobutyrate dehydrogenase
LRGRVFKDWAMNEPKNVSFLGLGVMGGAIARHIGKAGHHLTIYNRSPTAPGAGRRPIPDLPSRVATSPAEAAEGADVVLTCVGNDDDLADVVLGPTGVFSTIGRGAVFIDHTTVSARIARQIVVEARDLEVHCVDAPVTGGQAGAENGTLTVMCGGRPDAIEAARPIMEAYTKRIVHVGKAGAGQTTKMVNQIAFSGIIASLSEALRFAEAAHLDLDKVYEAISGGASQSWQMDNRWHTMAKDEFDFRLRDRLDAQGSGADAGRGPLAGRLAAGHRADRPVLCRGPGDRRRAAGYLRAVRRLPRKRKT